MVPPTLVQLAENYLAGPLSQSINNSIKKVVSWKCKVCFTYLFPTKQNRWQRLCIQFLSNKSFKLLLKSLRKHIKNTTCGKMNNIKSTFKKIISGIPPGSVVVPILFEIFFNDLFYFILVASWFCRWQYPFKFCWNNRESN